MAEKRTTPCLSTSPVLGWSLIGRGAWWGRGEILGVGGLFKKKKNKNSTNPHNEVIANSPYYIWQLYPPKYSNQSSTSMPTRGYSIFSTSSPYLILVPTCSTVH